ncbi:MAG: LamG-like jellyroll fold domain-containing protein [Bacteroidota bacterium]
MKHLHMLFSRSLIIGLLTILGTSVSWGQLVSEDFSYPDGNLVGNGGWVAHSGGGNSPVQVSNGQISIIHASGSREDVNIPLGTSLSGTDIAYASFDFSVADDAPIMGTDFEYFASFRGSALLVRVDIVAPDATGDFKVGLGVTSSTAQVTWGADLTFGTNYRAVVSYNFSTGEAILWVNPVDEMSTNIMASATAGGTISSYAFRQSSSTSNETITIDNLRVGTSFAEVTGPSSTPTTITLNPSKETTLHENAADNNAGGDAVIIAGYTNSSQRKRGLLQFDLSSIPADAVITSASLSMTVIQRGGGSPDATFNLHRLIDNYNWGEGVKVSPGGRNNNRGAAATAGEATWNNFQHPSSAWNSVGLGAGTDYAMMPTAGVTISTAVRYEWTGLSNDIQYWIDNPSENGGWLLKDATESNGGTASQFDVNTNLPVLTITYQTSTATALDFDNRPDGLDNIVNIGDIASLKPTENFTLEAWINPDFTTGQQTIISTGTDAPVRGYHMNILNNALWFNNTSNPSISQAGSITAGVWQHIALTYSTTNGSRIYIDGVLAGSDNRSPGAPLVYDSNPLGFGTLIANPTFYNFEGELDEVRIWGVERTQAEIQATKDVELTGTECDLLAYYNFNRGLIGGDNAGVTSLPDLTGNGNDGTLQNFILNGTSSNWIDGTVNGVMETTALPIIDPEVSITVSPSQTQEDNGLITFTYTFTANPAPTCGELTVYFSVGGSATYNDDYYLISGSSDFDGTMGTVTIPIGQTTTELIFQAQQDAINEPDEDIIVTIVVAP